MFAAKNMFMSPEWVYGFSPNRRVRREEEINFPLEDFRQPYFTGVRPQQRYKRDTFIDPEDYYDPLFGGGQRCDCRNCQMERYFKQRQNVKTTNPKQTRNQRRNHKDEEVSPTENKSLNSNSLESPDDDGSSYNGTQNGRNENKNIDVEKDLENMGSAAERVFESNQDVNESENDINDENTESKDHSMNTRVEQHGKGGEVKADETLNNQENEKDESARNIEHKIELINIIKSEVKELQEKVESISTNDCSVKNYDYLYCEEMLVKCLLKLDGILTEGEEKIRTDRKNVVNEINKSLSCLEMKVNNKEPQL